MLDKAIRTAARKANERKWEKIYVAVDWHDVICPSNYDEAGAFNLFQEAIPALQDASANKAICLILFSSSYKEIADEFIKYCKDEYGIIFEYFNCNPEVSNTDYGDFTSKFYYDVILEDKAGFDPEEDWNIFAKMIEIYFGDCYE